MDDFLRVIFGGYLLERLGFYTRKLFNYLKLKLNIKSKTAEGQSWDFDTIDQHDEFKSKVVGVIVLFIIIFLILITTN